MVKKKEINNIKIIDKKIIEKLNIDKKIISKLKKHNAKLKEEQEVIKKEVSEKLITLITAAFGLVAALAWNDTIKAIFQSLFGKAETVWAMITYSVLVTVIAVWVTLRITKMTKKDQK
ncbi:MAG: DUF5654 family protein [archaeon]|jgi:uncharacterized membrane protein YidH (DUF202 family)